MFELSKDLRKRIHKREILIGTWITIGHSEIAEILSDCSFDWLVIDMEHSNIDVYQAQQLIQIISLSNKVPLVRLPDQNSTTIKRVMDAGASGVLVPNVKTEEEAKNIVKAVKYPPIGTRGVGLARAQGYGFNFENYKNWINKGSIIIVQIEHYLGVENLKKILSVDGIDGMIIGPYDLSGSIGLPGELENLKVAQLVKKSVEICKKMNISAGYHIVQPNIKEVQLRIKQGFNFIGYSVDQIILGQKFRDDLKILNKL